MLAITTFPTRLSELRYCFSNPNPVVFELLNILTHVCVCVCFRCREKERTHTMTTSTTPSCSPWHGGLCPPPSATLSKADFALAPADTPPETLSAAFVCLLVHVERGVWSVFQEMEKNPMDSSAMQSHSIRSKMYTFYTQVLHHIATVGNRKGELIYKYIMCEMVCVCRLF